MHDEIMTFPNEIKCREERRGGRNDEKEGVTRKKERRGRRIDEEEGATRRVKK